MAVAMASWSELERRFEELQPALRGARLDCQQDDYGDRWHLAASDTLARAKFEMLSRIPGDKLTRLASKTQIAPEILAAPDALTRWYRFLASRFYKHYSVYQYNDSEGKATESWGSLGSIDDPAGAAAYHYLQLSPSDDDERDRPIAMTTILTGHNSRLNVNSVDNSTNAVTVTAPTPTVFDELIAAIHDARIPVEETAAVEQSVIEMRNAFGTPTFGERYTSFMSFLSDHMQVWGPVVAPYLAQIAVLPTQHVK